MSAAAELGDSVSTAVEAAAAETKVRQGLALPGAVLFCSVVLQRQVLHLHSLPLNRPELTLGADLARYWPALYADLQHKRMSS